MMRESLLTTEPSRRSTAEMSILLGQALEQVAKATGSVAHLYKNFEMGPNPGQFRIQPGSYDPLFEQLVQNTGSISSRSAAQPSQPAPVPAANQA